MYSAARKRKYCNSPLEEIDGSGREEPVDDQRSQSRREREPLERVLGREPRGRDVHAVEGAWTRSADCVRLRRQSEEFVDTQLTDELDVVRGRVEAKVVAQIPASEIDTAQNQHIELVEMKRGDRRELAEARRNVEAAD